MRDGTETLRDLAPDVAGLLLDLARSGVVHEVGEVPFDWFGGGKREDNGGDMGVTPDARPQVVAGPVKAKTETAKVVGAAAEVWQAGSSGGVVVVLAGLPLDGDAVLLVERMLDAVGCGALPLGWVGIANADAVRGLKDVGDKVGQAVAGLEAKRVLVLGGMTLQAWSGKTTGVEAWRPGRDVLPGLDESVAVGVTYAPEMLLAKPLFKRLAWRHLQNWEGSFEV